MKISFKGMNSEDKLNPIGSYILHHYYTSQISKRYGQRKIGQNLFCLNTPRDIPLIMHCAKQAGIKQYAMIVVCGGRHRTPIIIDDNKCYILESLGVSRSKVGKNSVAQIGLTIAKHNTDIEIHTPAMMRQLDAISCGTDAFLAIKETLRNLNKGSFVFEEKSEPVQLTEKDIIDSEELNDTYFANKDVLVEVHPDQPASVVKYTQSISILKSSRYRMFHEADGETALEFALRYEKPVTIEMDEKVYKDVTKLTGKDETVSLNRFKMSLSNSALAQRRNKHKRIFEQYKDTLSYDKLCDIIYEASGAALVKKYADTVPAALLQPSQYEDNVTFDMRDFYEQEINRNRPDDYVAKAPEQTISLSDIVRQTQHSIKPSLYIN